MTNGNTIRPFEGLINILNQEIAIYQKMATVIQTKQDAIIANKIDELKECVAQEKTLINESMTIAKKRQETQRHLSQRLNLTDQEPNLKTFIEIAETADAMKLSNLRYRLKRVLNQITRINNENKLLLDFSIEHVKGLAHLFLNVDNEDNNVYGMDGVVHMQHAGNKMLDFQI